MTVAQPTSACFWLVGECLCRVACVVLGLVSLSGCLAQQAELTQLKKDLDQRIERLDLGKSNLEKALQQTSDQLEQANQQVKELVQARARLREEIAGLREEGMAQLTGKLEESRHQLASLAGRLDDLDHQLVTMRNRVVVHEQDVEAQVKQWEERHTEQQRAIETGKKHIAELKEALDQQASGTDVRMADFKAALDEFKQALQGLGTQVAEEEQRAKEVSMGLSRRMARLAEQVETAEGKSASEGQLQEVTANVTAVAQTLERVSGKLGARVDEQAQQVGALVTRLEALEAHERGLAQQVETEGTAAETHLQEVTASVTSVAQALETVGEKLNARIDEQKQALGGVSQAAERLPKLETEVSTNVAHLNEMTRTMARLRETLEGVGTELGSRVDQQAQQVGALEARLEKLEAHEQTLVKQIEAKGQTTTAHVSEVNESVQSVAHALEQISQMLTSRVDEQEARIGELKAAMSSVPSLQADLETQISHVNELSQTVGKLRDLVKTIGTKMGARVDDHEKRLSALAKRLENLRASALSRGVAQPSPSNGRSASGAP